MNNILKATLLNTKILIPCIFIVLVGQTIGGKYGIIDAIPGAIIMLLICLASLGIKGMMPKLPLPAFAWAILLALLITVPYSPIGEFTTEKLSKISFIATTTPLLAFAGLTAGNSVDRLKRISWKIIITSLIVFTCVYFGGVAVAQYVLKFQGII
jgi:hypothetical protein